MHAYIIIILCTYVYVSTVIDSSISSIGISSSSAIVSTSLISSTQEILPTSSNAVPNYRPTGILVLLVHYVR